jgi:modification methylase
VSDEVPYLDTIINRDCSHMRELPDETIDLIISGPPYWSFIDYSAFAEGRPYLWQSDESYDDYLAQLKKWHQECFRVLRPGRFCMVVLGTLEREGRNYPIPFDAIPLFKSIGFDFRYEIVWNKVSGGRQSAKNFLRSPKVRRFRPNNRTEYILVCQKPISLVTEDLWRSISPLALPEEVFFAREVANNIWNIPSAQGRIDKSHPCPMPMELPARLIELFSVEGEIVLDPFMGSGTTAIAARLLKRHFVGYECENKFCQIARHRLIQLQTGTVASKRSRVIAKFDRF